MDGYKKKKKAFLTNLQSGTLMLLWVSTSILQETFKKQPTNSFNGCLVTVDFKTKKK